MSVFSLYVYIYINICLLFFLYIYMLKERLTSVITGDKRDKSFHG